MTRLALLLALAALALPGVASAAKRCSPASLEGKVMCPTCKTTLDQSNAPVADRMRERIQSWSDHGLSCSAIEDQLVAEFGPAVLAAPPKHGFGLLAWLLPLVGLGAGAIVVGALAWRWSRKRPPPAEENVSPEMNGRARLDPELERRVDEELAKFDG